MKLFYTSIIGLGITVIAVCCGFMLLFNWHALGFKTLDVPTGSMRPTIQPGSLVLMKSVPVSSIKVGDIITYTNPLTMKSTISHRVIKIYKINGKVPVFITKGDANPSPDSPVVGGLVKGQVIWHVPYLGEWMQWSKTWIGISILVYIPSLIIMAEEVIRMRDYLKSQQPYILAGYKRIENRSKTFDKRIALGFSLFAIFVLISAAMGPSVFALLKSNKVVLANNRLTVSIPNKCSGNTNNNNTVIVTNNNGQTSTTGNSSTTGGNGSVTSGNSTNNSSTSVTITLSNC